jgi:ribulose-phosphate 3-epimerase
MTVPIVPAFIPASREEVIAQCSALSFSHELHLDVVDGEFVPFVSWPYTPKGEPIDVKSYTDGFTLEVDLMVKKPFEAARAWEKAGADMVVFHIETIDVASLADFSLHTNVSVGISLHGDTHVEELLPYIPYADYVQIMGIKAIGQQGQSFDMETLSKVTFVQQHAPGIPVSVDGSVNEQTISMLFKAGVDRLIVGSAVVKQPDPQGAHQALRAACA